MCNKEKKNVDEMAARHLRLSVIWWWRAVDIEKIERFIVTKFQHPHSVRLI